MKRQNCSERGERAERVRSLTGGAEENVSHRSEECSNATSLCGNFGLCVCVCVQFFASVCVCVSCVNFVCVSVWVLVACVRFVCVFVWARVCVSGWESV